MSALSFLVLLEWCLIDALFFQWRHSGRTWYSETGTSFSRCILDYQMSPLSLNILFRLSHFTHCVQYYYYVCFSVPVAITNLCVEIPLSCIVPRNVAVLVNRAQSIVTSNWPKTSGCNLPQKLARLSESSHRFFTAICQEIAFIFKLVRMETFHTKKTALVKKWIVFMKINQFLLF